MTEQVPNTNDQEHLKDQLKAWGIDLEQFRQQAEQAGEDAEAQFNQLVTETQERLEAEREQVKQQLNNTSEQISTHVNKAWNDLKRAFENIGQENTEPEATE